MTPVRAELAKETCQLCPNVARYTRSDGTRTCALCAREFVSVRDIDLPSLLTEVDVLLEQLGDAPWAMDAPVGVQNSILTLRGMIGRKANP